MHEEEKREKKKKKRLHRRPPRIVLCFLGLGTQGGAAEGRTQGNSRGNGDDEGRSTKPSHFLRMAKVNSGDGTVALPLAFPLEPSAFFFRIHM